MVNTELSSNIRLVHYVFKKFRTNDHLTKNNDFCAPMCLYFPYSIRCVLLLSLLFISLFSSFKRWICPLQSALTKLRRGVEFSCIHKKRRVLLFIIRALGVFYCYYHPYLYLCAFEDYMTCSCSPAHIYILVLLS